jgi:hypothetical protein
MEECRRRQTKSPQTVYLLVRTILYCTVVVRKIDRTVQRFDDLLLSSLHIYPWIFLYEALKKMRGALFHEVLRSSPSGQTRFLTTSANS